MNIRVLSSNIRGDYFGNPVDERQSQPCDMFARYAPDIPGIQEAANSWNESALFASLVEACEVARCEGFPENNFVPLLWRRDVFDCAECGCVYFPDALDATDHSPIFCDFEL